MNILVLGSGGREHALARSIADSPRTDRLFVAPGNGGTAAFAQNVPQLSIEDGQAVLAFAQREDVQLVVVGPEAPLVAGVADALRQAGIDVFGPDAQGAQLEGSKTFSKRFMERNGIPTAAYGSFTDAAAARGFADQLGAPVVVKADGLAAGKGVVVAGTLEEAHAAIDECFSGAFGQAGAVVVVEECLTGPECSMLAFVSQGRALCMAPAQDHKRAFEGDAGPNTGGMGCYSPVPIVSDDELAAMQRIMQQAAEATAREFDHDYRGVLYGGFMLTPEGPKMLEFNARFGDPETQVVLPRLRTDLVDVLQAVAQGRPDDIRLEWADQWAVGVVLASAGYPGAYRKGLPIAGCDEAAQLEGVTVYHAGTARTADGGLVTAGGRVLCVTALGDTFEDARACAYSACTRIEFEGKQFRADIGERAARGRHAWGE
ncbi:phosphoribosylamine--glycine ligase [Eggerthellaceae bacterium zg-1084]|uniref:Phosphoribosylamine--glycine ligase n=1 Tax=Berryella wangjianweii TaxID=2734634 RepID=A0A6M8J7M9_9ACTN|nr:phosphoribosylamine--glycine ligase [Berryella wangjianweii]NPD30961.1 phosphoribosylamine--glycine ligase [Berryella wangjianweii]QKF07578.1 phosphoribosylamine--glycine ligase [Berryella wangjianweii]